MKDNMKHINNQYFLINHQDRPKYDLKNKIVTSLQVLSVYK